MNNIKEELKRFYNASEKDQAWMLNKLPVDIRNKVCVFLFGKNGWSGGVTDNGLYVSSGVKAAMQSGAKPTNFDKGIV
jgi:hypothetical protein